MKTSFILFFQFFLFVQLNAQCTGIFIDFFPGNETPNVGFCTHGDGLITIPVDPPGGTFSGPGVTANQFDSEVAGEGFHVINYTVTLACGTISDDITLFVEDCCPITNIDVEEPPVCDPFNPETHAPVNFIVTYTPNEFSTNSVFVRLGGATLSRMVSNPIGVLEQGFGLPYDGVEKTFTVGDFDGHCVTQTYSFTPLPCDCGLEFLAILDSDIPDCPDGTVSRTMKYRSTTAAEVSLDNGNTYIPGLIVPSSGGAEATFVIPNISIGPKNLVLRSTSDPNCITDPHFFNVFVKAPNPVCNDITVYLNQNGIVSITPEDVIDETDPAYCDTWQLQVSPTDFDCEDVGPNTISLTALALNPSRDEEGTCAGVVTVLDNLPPDLTCINTTVNFNGEDFITLDPATLVDAFDNCGVDFLQADPTTIYCTQIGTVVDVNILAIDVYGNPANCTAQVTVGGLPCGFSTCPGHVDCVDSYVSFDPADQTFHLTGVNCFYVSPYNSDELAYIKHDFCGNGEIIAKLESVSGSSLGWAGITLRENCEPGAKKMQIVHNMSNLVRREARTTTGGYAFPQQYPIFNRRWFKLVRQGNQFIAYISPNGVQWQFIGAKVIQMPYCIEAGLVVTNYQQVSNVTGVFSNVSINSAPSPLTAPNTSGLPDVAASPDFSTADLEQGTKSGDNFSVFPNPSTGLVAVEFSAGIKDSKLEVIDNLGQKVRTYAIAEEGPFHLQLSLGDLPKGIYFLRMLKTDGSSATQRLVLQ